MTSHNGLFVRLPRICVESRDDPAAPTVTLPSKPPAVGKRYAEMIERKVREAQVKRERGERANVRK